MDIESEQFFFKMCKGAEKRGINIDELKIKPEPDRLRVSDSKNHAYIPLSELYET